MYLDRCEGGDVGVDVCAEFCEADGLKIGGARKEKKSLGSKVSVSVRDISTQNVGSAAAKAIDQQLTPYEEPTTDPFGLI